MVSYKDVMLVVFINMAAMHLSFYDSKFFLF